MARFEWNDEVVGKVAREAVAGATERMQALLDHVLADGGGKDVAEVKAVLRSRWQSEFEKVPSDAFLNDCAERLAAGQRVVVQPEDPSSPKIS
ncbi:MAG TPA: hypothetical protein VGL78_06395 [Solirubrobacteraceae bacterium]